MPCRVDIEEPSYKQLLNQKTARCLFYVQGQLNLPVHTYLISDITNQYLNTDWAPELCGLLRSLPKDQLEALVYNAKSKDARVLADWWEEHQEVDRKRELLEQQKAEHDSVKASALAKLTDAEKAVLGIC